MNVYEEEFEVAAVAGHRNLLSYLGDKVAARMAGSLLPVRFAVTATSDKAYRCEIGVVEGLIEDQLRHTCSIFDYRQRRTENTDRFTSVLIVPTGIGAEIGGHAGDAGPVARLLAEVSDNVITHPNVVNASDVIDLPDNALYVEGSIISRFMMGTVGLQRVRGNRVLVVVDEHEDHRLIDVAVNSVSAARASYGLNVSEVVRLDPPIRLRSLYSSSGRAVGRVECWDGLLQVLDAYKGKYEALAVSSRILMPSSYYTEYYEKRGEMINPWGGVEAMFTHTISSLYDLPAAHSPMEESIEVANLDLGAVDPRMAAEAISSGYFMCVLRGLQRSPRIVKNVQGNALPGVLAVEDVSCMVIPDGCIGLPTLAALEQRVPVIAVRENRNIMRNTLGALPWAPDQLHVVENYWEAAGVVAALRAGVKPASVRRPLADTAVVKAAS
jgi:hypothetical protein